MGENNNNKDEAKEMRLNRECKCGGASVASMGMCERDGAGMVMQQRGALKSKNEQRNENKSNITPERYDADDADAAAFRPGGKRNCIALADSGLSVSSAAAPAGDTVPLGGEPRPASS